MPIKVILPALLIAMSTGAYSQDETANPGCLDSLDVPSAVSNCGDGINTGWSIYFPCVPEAFSIKVFNRWGEEIFSSTDFHFTWLPANENGETLPAGTYFYVLEFTYAGEEKKISGNVTLLC